MNELTTSGGRGAGAAGGTGGALPGARTRSRRRGAPGGPRSVQGGPRAGPRVRATSAEPKRSHPVGRPPGLLHSAGFRFAMVYAGLLAVSAAVLAFYLWWATAGLLDRQTEAAIRADAQGLSERWSEGGLPALVLTIRERLEQDVDDDAIYLLVDPNDAAARRQPARLARLGAAPRRAVRAGGRPAPAPRTLAQVQRYDLPGGYHLLIGRDVQARAKLRTLLADALLWGLAVVAVMALAGAFVVRSLFRRTLANVSATATAISAGDFAAGCGCPAAATSSTSLPRPSTTCSTGSAG